MSLTKRKSGNPPRKRKSTAKAKTVLPRQRKFKVGYITRVFEEAGKYPSKSDAEKAAKMIGNRYYFRYTKIKVVDYANPKRIQMWKSKKPEWK